MKSISEHLAGLSAGIDKTKASTETGPRTCVDAWLGKTIATKTKDGETVKAVGDWLASKPLTAGQKVVYSVGEAKHYGVIQSVDYLGRKATVTEWILADDDHSKAKASATRHTVPFASVEVLAEFPSATHRATAFCAWVLSMKDEA